MQSKATTVREYLASLPSDRRAAIERIREVMLANVGPDVDEGMTYGMIGYYIPHRVYPAGYHCKPETPVPYAGIASQKQYISIYLMPFYRSDDVTWLQQEWKRAGKKLDMGKCCIRIKQIEDLPLDVLAAAVRRVPGLAFLAHYQASLDPRTGKPKSDRPSTAKGKAKGKARSAATATAKPKARSKAPASAKAARTQQRRRK